MNFVKELEWRGMIHDIMPGTEDQLNREMTTAYVGIDPTADSLHIGHLVSVMLLKHFQQAGQGWARARSYNHSLSQRRVSGDSFIIFSLAPRYVR